MHFIRPHDNSLTLTYDPWVRHHLEQERTALLDSLSTIEEELRVVDSNSPGEGGAAAAREYYQERRLRELNLLRPLVGYHVLMIGVVVMMMMMMMMTRVMMKDDSDDDDACNKSFHHCCVLTVCSYVLYVRMKAR
jgi:hypothetical protein